MKTCLHTVSYAGTWGQAHLSLDESIHKAAELGFDGIMLMAKRPHGSLLDLNPERRKQINGHLQQAGVVCACIAGYTDFSAGAEHLDVPIREMQIAYVTELAKLADDLNCPLIRIFTAYETPQLSYSQNWDACVAAIRECSDRAAEFGVTIGVQNHHDIAAGTDAMRQFILAVDRDNCRACFDAWAPTLHGEDVVAAAARLADITVHTTAADYVKLPRYSYRPELVNYVPQPPFVQAVPMGEGIVDYLGFIGALVAGGFDGYFAYEMCSPLRGGGSMENLDACARKFVEFAKGG